MIKKTVVLLVALWLSGIAYGLTVPEKPDGYVNDYAKVLNQNEVTCLNQSLQTFDKKTSNQIVIALFPDLKNDDLDDFTNRLEEQWKIGQKYSDNGILIVAFMKQHQIRIEVGYGLESVVTDTMAGLIIRNDIAPAFKQGHYFTGLKAATAQLMQLTREVPLNKNPITETHSHIVFFSILALLLLVSIVFFVIAFRRTKNLPTLPQTNQIRTSQQSVQRKQKPRRRQHWFIFLLNLVWFLLSIFSGGSRGGRNDGNDSFKGGGGRSGGGGADGRW